MVALDGLLNWCHSSNLDISEVSRKTVLYVTVEPCVMCAAALRLLRILRVCVCVCVCWRLLWSFTSSQTFPGSCMAAGMSALEAVVLFWMFLVQIYLRLEAPFRFKRHLNVLFCCVCVCLCPLTFDLITLILCVQCVSGHRADEAVEMLKTFYKQENPNGTRNFSHYTL